MKYVIALFVSVVLAVVAGLIYLYAQVRFDAYKIIDYQPRLTTQIFDRNGKLIANIFDKEHRLYVKYDDIPARVIEALVAIEDTSYFEHNGVNPEAIFRAAMKDIKAMKMVEGASTLTQQLIKNVVLSREKSLIRKLNEVVLAFKIESELTKEEIIERYLNHVYFGHGYYGIRTAAEGYFHKNLDALTLKEIGILVGLPKAPSSYDPTRHLDLSLSRANRVLGRMQTLGWISESAYLAGLNEQPLIFDETLTKNRAPYVVDEVVKQAGGQFEDLKRGGYQIHLGLDIRLQDAAKKALKMGYENILTRDSDANASQVNGAIIAMENGTGNVLALVGGVDYEKSHFNRAIQSSRQPGSSFKPFIYQKALDFGYSTMSKIPDISRVYETKDEEDEDWKPKNYEENFEGLITLKEALVHSRNLATINLLTALGMDTVHKELRRDGFQKIPYDLSMALGTFGISPLNFARFYSAFPNGGEMVEPRIITKIVDRFGNENIYETDKQRITAPEQSYLMVDVLRSVVERGTGRNARVKGIEIAGKTGTTNNNVDAWFCGFSPEIEVLVWFGNDNNSPMKKTETGGRAAGPSFRQFMEEYVRLYPQTRRTFAIPENVIAQTFNGEKEYFTATSPPPKVSSKMSVEESGGLIF